MSHQHPTSHLAIPPQRTTTRQRSPLDIYPITGNNTSNTITDETIDLTIRFSTSSLSDLPLSLSVSPSSRPDNTTNTGGPTTATVKQLIRPSLPPDLQRNRLRLIHAGKALDDAVPLTTSLKRFAHSSSSSRRLHTQPGPAAAAAALYDSPYGSGSETDAISRSRQKGKTPIRDPPTRERIYVHCAIGDVALSAEDLASEVALANAHTRDSEQQDQEADYSTENGKAPSQYHTQSSHTLTPAPASTPAPRGFDRLLAAGFTPSEVHALRLQFVSVQAHTHTPETMPSPNTLRALEDQWLDDSTAAGGGLTGSGLGVDFEGGATVDDSAGSGRGALDDMIWGTTMGFFWPIGCVIWGTRETGIFSPRRKIAVVIGLVLNLGLGFVKWGG